MDGIFSIATIMLCTGVTTCVVAIALTYASLSPGAEKSTMWWCAAMWAGTIGLMLLAFRAVIPAWASIGVANSLVLMGYGFVRQGIAAFRNASAGKTSIWLGAAIWMAAFFYAPDFARDFNGRIILSSVMIATYAAIISVDIWKGWKEEKLPSYLPLFILFVTHGLVYALRAALAYTFPMGAGFDSLPSTWLAVMTMEVFVHVIGLSFTIFALSKERAENRYRMAAEVDSLTSAATRRFFVTQTRKHLAGKSNDGVLAVIDLDYFKSINDSHGHLAGDRVLRAFGEHVASRLEDGMLFGRMGGEEFALFLPRHQETEAALFVERLRAEIEAMDVIFMAHDLKVTMSAGLAPVDLVGMDFDHLTAAADAALYIAKDEGRNRIRVFKPSMRMHTIREGELEPRVGVTATRTSRRTVRPVLNKKARN
ncbi:GGDEF domain-containing protein [Rhizobium sp.]